MIRGGNRTDRIRINTFEILLCMIRGENQTDRIIISTFEKEKTNFNSDIKKNQKKSKSGFLEFIMKNSFPNKKNSD